jgi:hypothetical protein
VLKLLFFFLLLGHARWSETVLCFDTGVFPAQVTYEALPGTLAAPRYLQQYVVPTNTFHGVSTQYVTFYLDTFAAGRVTPHEFFASFRRSIWLTSGPYDARSVL